MSLNNQFQNGIVILGAGNVATHLSLALHKAGFKIKCVYSKTVEAAKKIAVKVNAHYTNIIDHLPVEADLYIVAVRDEVIVEIIRHLKPEYGVVVHTAGSISMNIFQGTYSHYGVLYPLQTFSKSRNVEFSNLPLFIEASDELLEEKLKFLANSISNSVRVLDSEKRKILHLSAVFACNFTNHMYSIANELIKKADVPFDILKPLIEETARKAIESDPEKAQTGPAVRNDQNVIQNHLEMLNDYPEFEKIYRFVSESIYELKNKKNK